MYPSSRNLIKENKYKSQCFLTYRFKIQIFGLLNQSKRLLGKKQRESRRGFLPFSLEDTTKFIGGGIDRNPIPKAPKPLVYPNA